MPNGLMTPPPSVASHCADGILSALSSGNLATTNLPLNEPMNQTPTRPPQSNSPRWLLLTMGLCLLWALLLALNWIPELRGAIEWQWPYAAPDVLRLLPLLFCVLVYVLVAPRLTNSRAIQLFAFAGAILIPVACLYVLGDPLYLLVTRTLSGQANGTHSAAAEITDLAATLRNWPQIMPTYLQAGVHPFESRHIALSPPGLPAFYYLLNQAMAALPALSDKLGMALRPLQCQNFAIMAYSNAQLASAWFGVLMPVWGGLAVFPLYRLGGKWAALWWPLVPALTMFTPDWNVLYPLLALVSYFLLDRALRAWNVRPVASAVL